MTATGRATGEQLFGECGARVPALRLSVRRGALSRPLPPAPGRADGNGNLVQPRPRLRRGGVPLLLANARLSERSARGYGTSGAGPRALGRYRRRAERAPTRSGSRRWRVRRRGHRQPQVRYRAARTGRLGAELRRATARAGVPRRQHAGRRGGVAARCAPALSSGRALVVIVPRHPQRFDEVARLLIAARPRVRASQPGGRWRRSAATCSATAWARCSRTTRSCDVALIGGSLLPFGGAEPYRGLRGGGAGADRAATFNFAEASDRAVADGAARRVIDVDQFATEARRLLTDAAARDGMREQALAFAEAHRGATARTLHLIESRWPRAR